ncbi:MAG: PD40 domain-containing protein [Microcoleus vaginatus WJT46-NPBG5]|nr:PD40 domain-containing protein [Microcoleus vaginatus WJT46-NPBG5]
MAENQNQPKDGEAVLGGNTPEPINSAVLGGIEGVKSRLASGDDNQKIAALHQAWNYGEDGIKLVLCALKDKSLRVRKFASTLLKENLTIKQNLELLLSTLKDGSGSVQYAVCSLLEAKEPALKEALQAYNPYQLTCFRILDGPFSGNTAFSPDGTSLVSALWTYSTIQLWDTGTGTLKSTFTERLSKDIQSLAFSPDGQTLAVCSSKHSTIHLWDTATGNLRSTLKGHSYSVNSVAFSPDGKTLASGSNDKTIKVWDTATGNLRSTLTGHSYSVTSVAFSPNGKTLASVCDDKTIKLWNTATGTLRSTLTGHSYSVNSVAFIPKGKTLASGSNDETIKLWDTNTGSLTRILEVGGTVLSVVLTPDRKILAITRGDGIIQLWHTDTGQLITSSTKGIENAGPMAISPDGKMLAIRCSDWTIKLWRIGHIHQSTLDLGELFNRYFALKEALESGQAGLDLIVSALKDKSLQMRQIAFSLLSNLQEPSVTEALQEYRYEPLYARLRYLLAAERWKEAEEETENILLILSGCEKGADIKTILNQHTIYKKLDYSPGPDKYSLRCKILDQDLEIISELWESYSNSRASFSEQKLSLGFWLGCKEEIDRYFESARRMARNFEEYEREHYAGGYGIDRS